MKISAMPYLHVVLEPCTINDAQLKFTDPCSQMHDLHRYSVTVKRARVVGSIDYIISAQSTISDISGEHASVSDFYTVQVNRVIGFIDDCSIYQTSIIVEAQNLGFDTPAEYVYGNNHALKIKGEFALNIGYVVNGSFENEFAGWTQNVPPGATAETVTHFDKYCPVDGCYFALLKTDGPGSQNLLQQDIYADVGDILSGWSFFKTNDYMPFNDYSKVVLKSGDTVVATLFDADVQSVGDYGSTPWTQWSHTFDAEGLYTIEALITNSLDSIYDSYLGVDAVKLTPASSEN